MAATSAASSAHERPSRREQRRAQIEDIGRSHLLDAAEEVFGQKGYHDTSIKEIARLAEFSVGSVYSFFESKDALFRQIFVRRGDEFMPGLHAVVDGPGAPLERLHALVAFQVRFFREHPHFGRIYVQSATPRSSSPEEHTDPVVAERHAETLRLQAALVAEGQRAGQFGPGDADVLARLLAGIVTSFVACDPAVARADPDAPEALPLARFQEIVEAALRAGPGERPAR